MRPKVIAIVAVLGFLVIGSLLAIRHLAEHPIQSSEPQAKGAEAAPVTEKTATDRSSQSIAESPVAAPKESAESNKSSEDAHQGYVEKRSAELMDLAMNDDRASMDSILAELTNRDPQIRKAAREATIQFGSRDAIPKLADAASQTDDPNEKAALADAIEFLKLPSLTEIMSHSAKPADGQAVAKASHKGAFGKRDLPVPAPAPNQ